MENRFFSRNSKCIWIVKDEQQTNSDEQDRKVLDLAMSCHTMGHSLNHYTYVLYVYLLN